MKFYLGSPSGEENSTIKKDNNNWKIVKTGKAYFVYFTVWEQISEPYPRKQQLPDPRSVWYW